MNIKGVATDLKASIIVFIVALPLCLGIALASGAPLFSGFISGIIGGVVVGLLSNSQISVSGPAAGLTIIVLAAIKTLGSFEAFLASVVIAGIFQIILGKIKGGSVADFFPISVVRGMLAAIGLLLIFKEIPYSFGYINKDSLLSEISWGVDKVISYIHPGVMIICFLSLVILVIWEKFAKKGNIFFKIIPGSLFVVIFGVFLDFVFREFFPSLQLNQTHLVRLHFSGGFSALIHKISFPDWSALQNIETYKVAFVIAAASSMASLLCTEATDSLDPEKRVTSKNKELVAQGAGNLLSGLIGGLPIAAVIVRSSANVIAGGRTKLSSIMHGVLLFFSLALIPQIIDLIPLAVLAAILIIVGLKLTSPSIYKNMFLQGREQFVPFIVTIVFILATDLLTGVLVGMSVSVFFVMKANVDSSITMRAQGEHFVIRFMKDSTFLNKPLLKGFLQNIPDQALVILESTKPIVMDRDIILIFESFLTECKSRGITVKTKQLNVVNYDF